MTSPKASECPPTVKISTDMQLIGNINKSRKNDSISIMKVKIDGLGLNAIQGFFFYFLAHDRAELELDSVAVDWVNWRLSRHCNVCKREFDSSATGVSTHCRRCGQLYCMRCIPRYIKHFLQK